jgi:hypothetical protein
MKKTYYHAFTMDKMKSVMQSGLIKNISDNGVYFTDDAISSLDWIRCREELWFKRKHKSLGLAIFEVDTDDELLIPFQDYANQLSDYFPQKMKDAQQSECVIYQKTIHPSLLKFEECFIDGDDYDCVELVNTQKYSAPTKKMRIDLMMKGFENMLMYDTENKEYIVGSKTAHYQINGNPKLAEEFYNKMILHWKTSPHKTKQIGGKILV